MVLTALLLLGVGQDGLAAFPAEGDFASYRFGGGEVGADWTELTIHEGGALIYRHMTTFGGRTPVRLIERRMYVPAPEARETLRSLTDGGLFALKSRRPRGVDVPTAAFRARMDGRSLDVSLPMLFTPHEPPPAPEVFTIFRSIRDGFTGDGSVSSIRSEGGLLMWVESAVVAFQRPEEFSLSVAFENSGAGPVVILPESLSREFLSRGKGEATYQPYPGPPVPPWRGALALGAGERKTVTFEGLRDSGGVWLLELGAHLLNLSYKVAKERAELRSLPTGFPEGRIWTGELRPLRLPLTYRPDAPKR
jgi:hypothetical protein